MTHRYSVFKNSCLRVPVDPVSKMPKTAYERKKKTAIDQCSIDSPSTACSVSPHVEAEKLKDFYQSIPDYNDINHLPEQEFYSTLKSLREKKTKMLNLAVEHIDDNGFNKKRIDDLSIPPREPCYCPATENSKEAKSKLNSTLRRRYSDDKRESNKTKASCHKGYDLNNDNSHNINSNNMKRHSKKNGLHELENNILDDVKGNLVKTSLKEKGHIEKPKRNHSACSISWNDTKVEQNSEIDEKFKQYFEEKRYRSLSRVDLNDEFKTQSMPSSPLRTRRNVSPTRKNKNITIPKPFKMTERDEEDRIVNELRSLRKSFSDDMLDQKCKKKQFRANPIPIESRIPLYDKILEDQAMRRAITKINSEAELRAQMKPFSFTKREEKGLGVCERVVHALPRSKKKKKFRARPVPKNLFSNYFYDKTKEDNFFRSMNRRIRAEELLRVSNYPCSMGARDRSRLSTPAAHSDLPIDPSPAIPSIASSDRQRASSPVKIRRKEKFTKEDMITTSPQPFKFSTADRAAKKMQDVATKIYQESVGSVGNRTTNNGTPGSRAYSALDLRTAASGRSNLAALLRAEAVRQKFEMESTRRFAEQRRRMEMRQRDRLLRSKPAWHLVKNNHEEDIAMRLQTRRDEEKMRREEFLHEMELMYGRVSQQPMLFERYYAPRPHYLSSDTLQLSPRKISKKRSLKNKSYHYCSPTRSRKVSINDTAETFNRDVADYLNRVDDDKLYSDSEVAIDSLDGDKYKILK